VFPVRDVAETKLCGRVLEVNSAALVSHEVVLLTHGGWSPTPYWQLSRQKGRCESRARYVDVKLSYESFQVWSAWKLGFTRTAYHRCRFAPRPRPACISNLIATCNKHLKYLLAFSQSFLEMLGHRHNQGEPKRSRPLIFLTYLVVLRLEKRCPKPVTVTSLGKIFGPSQDFGFALRYCLGGGNCPPWLWPRLARCIIGSIVTVGRRNCYYLLQSF